MRKATIWRGGQWERGPPGGRGYWNGRFVTINLFAVERMASGLDIE